MAEGAGVPFVRLLVPNCGEEFTSAEPVGGGRRRRLAAVRRPLHRRRRRRRGPPHRRPQHGLVRHRRGQQRALRPHRAATAPASGPRRRALPAHPGHELARHRQREQLGALHRQPHRRAQRLRAPLDAGGATLEEARERGLLAGPRPRHQPVLRRHRRPALGPRDVGRPRTPSSTTRRGVHGAHQPLRRAGDAPYEGYHGEESRRRLLDRRAAARRGPRRRRRPGRARAPGSCAATSRRPGVHLRPPRARRGRRPSRA